MRYGWDGITSPGEEAALRLAQAEHDRELVEQELAREHEDEKRFAAEAKAAPARLKQATEEYIAARRHAEVALVGATLHIEPGTETVEVVGLMAALAALVPARRAYDEAFSVADKYGVLGDHYRVAPLGIAPHLHKLMNLAAQA